MFIPLGINTIYDQLEDMMKKTHVSDQAVLKATGKDWNYWFTLLDEHGGKECDHKAIVAILDENSDLDGWWQQMVTVEYEIARGLRKAHETPDGFQIGKSKTISAPLASVYSLWVDDVKRREWLDDPGFTIRKAKTEKSLRITWVDSITHVDVYFYPKRSRTQVTVNHKKMADSKKAKAMKAYWGKQLEQLAKSFL